MRKAAVIAEFQSTECDIARSSILSWGWLVSKFPEQFSHAISLKLTDVSDCIGQNSATGPTDASHPPSSHLPRFHPRVDKTRDPMDFMGLNGHRKRPERRLPRSKWRPCPAVGNIFGVEQQKGADGTMM